MPRTARFNPAGVTHHLIWRFVDRAYFFRDDQDRALYLRLLGRALVESDWRCLAYALMSNHIHLAVVAGEQPMESWTRRVNPIFAQAMNKMTNRLGPMFAARARDYAFTPRREGGLVAYIHNNPVRAGVVRTARESSWTSHRAYMGLVTAPPWLRVAEGLQRAGFENAKDFDAWVGTSPGERSDVDVEKHRQEVRRLGGIELGTPTADGDMTRIPLMAKPFAHVRPDPRSVIAIVSSLTGVSVPLICSRRRLGDARMARKVAVHCGLTLGLTKSDLAAALGISAQAVHATSRRTMTIAERISSDQARKILEDVLWTRRHAA